MDATSPSLLHDTLLESERAPIHPLAATLIARNAENLARFYEEKLGFARLGQSGDRIRLGAGPVGFLDILHRPAAKPHSGRGSGLFHIAFLLPDRAALGRWFIAARAAGAPFDGASDHAVSEAFYLSDPEGNGIEVYVDRPRSDWPREGNGVAMTTGPMAVRELVQQAAAGDETPRLPEGTRIGHFHLQVGDVDRAAAWWHETLGTEETHRRPSARFHSWGGYHHHLGLNSWNSAGAGPRDPEATGLHRITFAIRDPADFRALAAKLGANPEADELLLTDPFGINAAFRRA